MDGSKPLGVLDFLFKDGLQQTGINSTTLPTRKSGEIPEVAIIRREFNMNIEFTDGDLAGVEDVIDFGKLIPVGDGTGSKSGL